MYKIAICEDERDAMKYISALVKECCGDAVQITEYVEAVDLLDEWEKAGRQMQEIILMDICFQDENGICIAKKIQQRYPHTYVIFITGFVEYASEIFQADPVYFLIKPVSRGKLKEALGKAFARLDQNENTFISFPVRGGVVQLVPRKISYIESRLKEVDIHDGKEVWSVHMKLRDIERKLPENFVRIHQSYLVNMDYVSGFTRQRIVLRDRSTLPVSRARYPDAKEKFMNYLHSQM